MSTEIPPQSANIELPNAMQPVAGDPGDQWLETRLSIRPELRFDTRNKSSGAFVVIEDPVRSKFFQIGTDEYRFIASLNGDHTVREIIDSLVAKNPESIDEHSAKTICQWLINSNLVYGHEVDNATRLDQQARAISKQKLIGLLNPICFRVRLFNPNRALTAVQPYTQWFFSKSFLAIWMIVSLFALRVMYSHREQIGEASIGILSDFRWFWLLIIWVALKIIHEAAHGVACRKYGGEVPDAGILLLLFTPMAFVNVTSSWRFSSRWHRIVVAAAGMYVELLFAFLSLIAWSNLEPGILADLCFNVFIMASVTTILFNANPLMRFDGYYILSDVLGVPNLYPKGTKWFGDRIKNTIFGVPKTPNICKPSEIRRVAIYGSMAFFWKILISLSLIIGASVLFYGAGVALAACGVGLWFGLPIYRQLQQLFGPKAIHPINWHRVALSLIVIGIFSLGMFTVLRGPVTKSAPAIVQFKDELPLRANASGFIRKILVEDGQCVQQNDVLIKLENPELMLEVHQLEHRAEEARIQTRIYRQTGETALAQAEQKKHASLLEQLAEKQTQSLGLVLRAPFDGFVFQRDLANNIGSFVHRGDELIHIAQQQTKEIVVSIDQSDLESLKGNEGQMLRVAFPGHRVFDSELIRIDPRADDKPSHPTLCANVGGPLPVLPTNEQADGAQSVRLLNPRFTADLSVTSNISRELQSGQRGRAFFSTQRQSLGSYLYLAVCDWFERKLENATQTAVF